MKTCCKCNETKPLESFFMDCTKASGRQSMCKPCKIQTHREYKWRLKHDPGSVKRLEPIEIREGTRYNTKLEPSDIILIRGLFDFLNCSQIAEKFEVSPSTISSIKNGKTWTWVK